MIDGYSQFRFDTALVPTPCFVVDTGLLRKNLQVMQQIRQDTDCKILLALKGFAMFSLFPLISSVLDGICASSPHEARLGREEFCKEVHAFAAAYSEHDILQLCKTADHIVFNSKEQLLKYHDLILSQAKRIEFALRINPEHSEGTVPIYDPCAPGSRLGIKLKDFEPRLLSLIKGLHWHNLCEQGADCLERTLQAVSKNFAPYFHELEYVNFGGGHHITRPDYDTQLLCSLIHDFKQKYKVQVYLEPGEAVVLNTGYLVTTILDIVSGDNMPIAIMDMSVPAHTPDVIEMPYRPHIVGSAPAHEKKYTYRLGGLSCLAGDVAGEYSFDQPLQIGDKLVFTDMAHYSMVKTNTFNGIQLPSIATYDPDKNNFKLVKQFGYPDFKNRLS